MESREIGKRVKQLRRALGWRQSDLAERAGVSPSYISRIESGEGNPKTGDLVSVAEALGVSRAGLLGLEADDISQGIAEKINAYPGLRPKVERLVDWYGWSDETKRGLIESLLDVFMQINTPEPPKEEKRDLTESQTHYNANNSNHVNTRKLVSI